MEHIPNVPSEVIESLQMDAKKRYYEDKECDEEQDLQDERITFWEPPLYHRGFFRFSTLLGMQYL